MPAQHSGIRLDVPDKMLPFMSTDATFKVSHGGRGGAKSWTIARMLLVKAYTSKQRILCTREFQTSITDSVHKLLKDQIVEMGLVPWFKITDTEISCPLTGSTFLFKGIRRNINEIKSTEGITITWVEEAQAVSENSWVILIPTVLRTPGAEVWLSFNPVEDSDPTYKRFVLSPPPGSLVIEMLWSDNPWFPPKMDEQRRHMLATDPDAYDWVWGGHTRHISEASIFRGRFKIEPFDADPNMVKRFYYGVDWGFANDPTVLVRFWVDTFTPGKRKLRIDYEAVGVGVEIDELPTMFRGGTTARTNLDNPSRVWPGVPGCENWPMKADAARPETISYVRRQGFNIAAAKKWSGSVEDGVQYLKAYNEIIIHPRCVNMAQEARLYSYKVDRQTNDILPEIEDAHNHGWDAVRYGHDGLIRAKGAYGSWQRLAERG